jgi:hypothetical protein
MEIYPTKAMPTKIVSKPKPGISSEGKPGILIGTWKGRRLSIHSILLNITQRVMAIGTTNNNPCRKKFNNFFMNVNLAYKNGE